MRFPVNTDVYTSLRQQMVERQLRLRGIAEERVLQAMLRVPRHEFAPERFRDQAYEDHPLPIGEEQTISQPYIVALMTEALRPRKGMKVLEVGTGSGYTAAVLARLAAQVVSIERHRDLASSARRALEGLGVGNVELRIGDGSRGVPERAPFDAIAVHATAPAPPPALLEQLADGGRLVLPVAAGEADMLTLLRRRAGRVETTSLGPCRFVPLIGEGGFGE